MKPLNGLVEAGPEHEGSPARRVTDEPLLLTPGPLTISAATKRAMIHDYGSRDKRIIELTRSIRQRLVRLAGASATHECVPLQGSGTYAIEAMMGTLVPRDGRVLVLVNGAYGRRISTILRYMGRAFTTIDVAEDTPIAPGLVDRSLIDDPGVSHVAAVYCETTTGLRNPIEGIAEVVDHHGRNLLIDAMSAFGALPIDAASVPFEALVASANKCLEGPPGFAYAIVERMALEAAAGNAPSFSLDLHDQWVGLERNGQWRFTPPTHVLLGFEQALVEFDAEGGVAGRGARYSANCAALIEGMTELGFRTFIAAEHQAPIIATFHNPAHRNFDFDAFYRLLREDGYVIYPGKVTEADTFRIGCIGHLTHNDMTDAVAAVGRAIEALRVDLTSEVPDPVS